MKSIKYTPYWSKTSDIISKELEDLIMSKDPYFEGLDSKIKIHQVESPFILADNVFDLREANNDLIEIGVKRNKTVEFTGGGMYIEFEKNGEGVIVHGNEEEGYNIFLLQ